MKQQPPHKHRRPTEDERTRARRGGTSWWASCIWDALGVAAMLKKSVRVKTSCGCCGEDMSFEVHDGPPRNLKAVIHFAVPARRWYENIVFT